MAALYVGMGAPTPAELIALVRGGPRIAPGFVGMANFGRWRLICVPGPPALDGLDASAPASTPSANACRINQEMPAPQETAQSGEAAPKVIVAANFSLVGPKRMPAAMLRLPATAQPGDEISLRFDDGAAIKTVVRDCAATECVAAATLTAGDWARLSDARSLKVTFPAARRQWVLLDIPVEGLSTAIAALSRAEVSPAG
jgi:invasion protein IalB